MKPEGKDEGTVKLLRALTPLALLALSVPCHAGESQGTDLQAGYSFARIDDGDRHGANGALGFDLFGPIDGFVDVASHWGTKDGTDLSDLTLMAGPGLRFGKRGGTVVFVRALAGLVEDRASIAVLDVDISETSSRFGVLGGGGVDVRIAHRLALRLQGDYFWNDVPEGGKASGFRAGAGLVYRFGTLP
jgi:opacity protein-like surface antigen